MLPLSSCPLSFPQPFLPHIPSLFSLNYLHLTFLSHLTIIIFLSLLLPLPPPFIFWGEDHHANFPYSSYSSCVLSFHTVFLCLKDHDAPSPLLPLLSSLPLRVFSLLYSFSHTSFPTFDLLTLPSIFRSTSGLSSPSVFVPSPSSAFFLYALLLTPRPKVTLFSISPKTDSPSDLTHLFMPFLSLSKHAFIYLSISRKRLNL